MFCHYYVSFSVISPNRFYLQPTFIFYITNYQFFGISSGSIFSMSSSIKKLGSDVGL
eukprot:UN07125